MRHVINRPILYIDKDANPESQEAKQLLKSAGFHVDVKIAPGQYRAAPILFGLFNKFEGLDGIRIFLKNATRP